MYHNFYKIRYLQGINGFDKSEIREVLSMYHRNASSGIWKCYPIINLPPEIENITIICYAWLEAWFVGNEKVQYVGVTTGFHKNAQIVIKVR